ncbi:hypothetical protein LRAMOSA09583 [Lichtheimia ramosa]|uniref:Uncharacterized protein n=1 Tax=Lichtheimia ramosa TaxID=688394 RepID=A0A077WIB1_9FUNG|nr:hypothetical protein LRAMOSA09583 [Lichtheimia ramosa]
MLKTISNEEHLQQPTIHIEDMEEAEEQVMNNNDGSSKKKVVSRISMFFQQKKEKQKTPASESDEPYIGSGNYMCNSDATQVKVEQQHQQSHGLYFPTDHHLDPFASSMSTSTSPQNNTVSPIAAATAATTPTPTTPTLLDNATNDMNSNNNNNSSEQLSSSSSPTGGEGAVDIERKASVRTNTTQPDEETTQSNAAVDSKVNQLRAELRRQRLGLENLEIERQQYRSDCRALMDRLGQLKERLQQRQQAREQLQKSYEDHMRSLRATDDDLTSISAKIRKLRHMIATLADDLLENVDPVRATFTLRDFWLNLREPIEQMGTPLKLNQIRMLTEKYMMDFLILNMTPYKFPGLPPHKQYNQLEMWLKNHDRNAAVRLRQELARAIVRTSKDRNNTLLEEETRQTIQGLYKNLNEAYPYMQQYDKVENDPTRRYEHKVRELVEFSLQLGFAMKGQEVDIAATLVQEGTQLFNPALMEEEQGLKSGVIEFCICPPFVVYNAMPYTLLEKGRVYCHPQRA